MGFIFSFQNTLKIRGVCSDNESWTEMKYLLQSRVVTMECAPFYIINKLIKVNAHIARIDWPHFYPDYFLNIFKVKLRPKTKLGNLGERKYKSTYLIYMYEGNVGKLDKHVFQQLWPNEDFISLSSYGISKVPKQSQNPLKKLISCVEHFSQILLKLDKPLSTS